jgi:putative transposase
LRRDQPVKGPWPTPAVDSVEALSAKYAEAWPAWGHRKIAALMRADGHVVSTSTVERALRRRGLLLPRGYRADRKSWAAIRRRVFHDPPTRRNRVWQTDFSEFETSSGGIWRICAVIDYATKYCLAITLTPTGRGQDALACLMASVEHAQRLLGLDDLRTDRGDIDLIDETTGELLRTVPAPDRRRQRQRPVLSRRSLQDRVRRRRSTAAPRPHEGQIAADQRCYRTILRHPQIRAPLPRPDRQRRRPRHGSPTLPPDL